MFLVLQAITYHSNEGLFVSFILDEKKTFDLIAESDVETFFSIS